MTSWPVKKQGVFVLIYSPPKKLLILSLANPLYFSVLWKETAFYRKYAQSFDDTQNQLLSVLAIKANNNCISYPFRSDSDMSINTPTHKTVQNTSNWQEWTTTSFLQLVYLATTVILAALFEIVYGKRSWRTLLPFLGSSKGAWLKRKIKGLCWKPAWEYFCTKRIIDQSVIKIIIIWVKQ